MGPVVVIADHPAPSLEIERELLEPLGAEIRVPGPDDDLTALAADADAIMTCFALVPAETVAASDQLKVVGRFGVGVDNIAVEAATERGVPVTNVPEYCSDEVAEHTLAFLLALARGVTGYDRRLRRDDWELASGSPLFRVAGKALGLVGFGRIGQAVAARARVFGLEILTFDPTLPADEADAAGAARVDLGELLARSDFVSLHAPLTDATRHLIGRDELRAMKPTAFLINAARGAIIDLDALAEALREGEIAGAALDVFEPERLPPDHPLVAEERVVTTPHVAFYSEESIAALRRLAVENVVAVLEGRRPASVVNPEVMDDPRPGEPDSPTAA